MIDVRTAQEYLNMGARIGQGQRADEQLEGAVALHNILCCRNVAYLADEVGMGKTYVALGALALFRHLQPSFRVMIIAPRENIQLKWMKELGNFVRHNVREADLRVKALGGGPARPMVSCSNLLSLVHESVVDPNRDFFARLTSFSLPLGGRDVTDPEAARKMRDGLRRSLPWIGDEVFDLRNRQAFKDNVARAVCCALPVFDLVIVDEGHNLKHGFSEHGAARNRVLSMAFGYRPEGVDPKLFPYYGPRARKVLFLSATPIEETYRHLWNQLDIFGLAGGLEALVSDNADEAEKKRTAAKFLVRRVTAIRVGGKEHTKNLYRREWRRGGVNAHDEPIRVEDDRQRLIVALMQKKVTELISCERFNPSFQVGMLASFESFLETTKSKETEEQGSNFDDAAQTESPEEKEGIDVAGVNTIARSYRKLFGEEMPHPKMDALVDSLANAWRGGEKALVFVRRVASVKELKAKLDERYDAWLIGRLKRELPSTTQAHFDKVVRRYRDEKINGRRAERHVESETDGASEATDGGGSDTFFAWFFRGAGPKGVVSGALVQRRFRQRGTTVATFFEDNYLADLLGCEPGSVEASLATALGISVETLQAELRRRSAKFLSAKATRQQRADRFEALQAAAVEWLSQTDGPFREAAGVVWRERFAGTSPRPCAAEGTAPDQLLETRTFFTELRCRPALRARVWPASASVDPTEAFRERELRAQLLASAARLGHAFIDLYIMTIGRLGNLELGVQDSARDEGSDAELDRIEGYLRLLEAQMLVPRSERDWSGFDELADLAENFDLLLDVNAPDARTQPLSEAARTFGNMLAEQAPTGGMAGQVNKRMVGQFRLPGYPLVLVSTDLLQEGEDLHTFCSAVYHYGVSWTPSAMEQRIGRIDRVRSQTDRRLQGLADDLRGEHMLQVYFPHLEDTVEVLQVQRVLERMNVFLRLMHEGLSTAGSEEKKVDVARELARGRKVVEQIRERLRTAFPVEPEHLTRAGPKPPDCRASVREAVQRFHALAQGTLPELAITWEAHAPAGRLLGTALLGARRQPFTLLLHSYESRILLRCVSPVGRVSPDTAQHVIKHYAARHRGRIGAIATCEDATYDLTVEDDVLLGTDATHDGIRVALLIRRVTELADELEQQLLPGHDEALAAFREKLSVEELRGQ